MGQVWQNNVCNCYCTSKQIQSLLAGPFGFVEIYNNFHVCVAVGQNKGTTKHIFHNVQFFGTKAPLGIASVCKEVRKEVRKEVSPDVHKKV